MLFRSVTSAAFGLPSSLPCRGPEWGQARGGRPTRGRSLRVGVIWATPGARIGGAWGRRPRPLAPPPSGWPEASSGAASRVSQMHSGPGGRLQNRGQIQLPVAVQRPGALGGRHRRRPCFNHLVGIPDHLTCLLKNLYAGQETTVRTGHETTDWFQIGKGVCQGCILSPCVFNLYAEYIMRNAGLEEAQDGIKIAARNINNLRYADDTTLMEESEEELDESEREE